MSEECGKCWHCEVAPVLKEENSEAMRLIEHYADALIEIVAMNGPRALRGWMYDPVRAENSHYCTAARALGIL